MPDGESLPKLYFKNGVPPQLTSAIEQFESAHGPVEIISTRKSKNDLENRANRIENKLKAKGFETFMMVPFAEDLSITAKLPEGSGIMPGMQAVAQLLDMNEDDEDLEGLELEVKDGPDEDIVDFRHTRGGEKIFGGGYQCTCAFSARRNGEDGVLSAGHCGSKMDNFDSDNHSYSYWMQSRVIHMGGYGDIAFYATDPGHFLLGEYWASPTDLRKVTGYDSSQTVGEGVCAYSRMQGTRTCTSIYRTGLTICYSGYPCVYGIVATTHDGTVKGDSGGPWSWGTVADGITSGGSYMDGAWRSLYTPIDRALVGTGSVLVTG